MDKETDWLLKEKYFGKLTEKFYRDIKRLEAGEPLDYVIGFTEFLGCRIDLSKKPLIPRPETEFWVEKAIGEIKKFYPSTSSGQNLRILDIFSGSGCIGIAVLKNLLLAQRSLGEVGCDFADIDKKSLEQIKINLKINKISRFSHDREKNGIKYRVVRSDIFSNIKNKYDFIFANPPYISTKNRNRIQKAVLKYEPRKALFGGKDGLFYIKKFLRQAKNHLNENGKIYMEFDSPQKNKMENMVIKYGYKNCEFHKDQYGKWRWVMVK